MSDLGDLVKRLRMMRNKAAEEAADEIERLRAEVAALTKDAERYRWLRDPRIAHWETRDKHGCMLQGKRLDESIDAALWKEKS